MKFESDPATKELLRRLIAQLVKEREGFQAKGTVDADNSEFLTIVKSIKNATGLDNPS